MGQLLLIAIGLTSLGTIKYPRTLRGPSSIIDSIGWTKRPSILFSIKLFAIKSACNLVRPEAIHCKVNMQAHRHYSQLHSLHIWLGTHELMALQTNINKHRCTRSLALFITLIYTIIQNYNGVANCVHPSQRVAVFISQ